MDQNPVVPPTSNKDQLSPTTVAVDAITNPTNGLASGEPQPPKVESSTSEPNTTETEASENSQNTEKENQENNSNTINVENISNLDVAELTSQIMEMINQDDDGALLSHTELLKKNVELQEFMVKLIELLREKTNLNAKLERQNSALTNQARSLRDVIAITKELLNTRNMEVEHLHVDMATIEKCIKEERERNNMAVQRLSEAMTLNDKLKTEYLNQMELFQKLREKYNEKVVILTKENQHLRESLKERPLLTNANGILPAEVIPEAAAVATDENNAV